MTSSTIDSTPDGIVNSSAFAALRAEQRAQAWSVTQVANFPRA
jgi:hypothetical protein